MTLILATLGITAVAFAIVGLFALGYRRRITQQARAVSRRRLYQTQFRVPPQ